MALPSDHSAQASVTADSFLWPHLEPPPLLEFSRVAERPELVAHDVIDITPVVASEQLTPAGMYNQWPLEVLTRIDKSFTGLVVLISLANTRRRVAHNESLLQSVTGFVASLLGENDFGCRTTGDEFVIICPGLQGTEPQRRLNQISEELWQYQQRGNGAFSFLFSWGGVAARERTLSAAMASAEDRMNSINRNRLITSKESVNHRRKAV